MKMVEFIWEMRVNQNLYLLIHFAEAFETHFLSLKQYGVGSLLRFPQPLIQQFTQVFTQIFLEIFPL